MPDKNQHFYNNNSPYDKDQDSGGFLKNLENQAGAAKDSDSKEDLSPNGLYKSERGISSGRSGLYSKAGPTGARGIKNFFWGSRKRKIVTSGTGASGGIIGIFMAILFAAAGPAQLVQLSHVLQSDFTNSNHTSSLRLNKMFQNTGPDDDIGQTRLGLVGSRLLNPIKTRLTNAGITFDTNSTGAVTRANFDISKLKAANPALSDYTTEEMRQYVAETVGVDQSAVKGTGILTIDASDVGGTTEIPITVSRLILKGSLDILDTGQILTGISMRVLKAYYDVPSLYHPIDLLKSKLRQISTSSVETNDEETKDVNADVISGLDQSTGFDAVRASLQNALGGTVGDLLSKALIGTAVLCAVRGAVGDVIKFDRDAIALPAALEALRMIAIGDQIESGQDISAGLVGGAVNGLVGSNGQSVWAAKSLQVTANTPNPSGPDLPTEYGSAFNVDTTASNLLKGIDLSIGGISLTGVACSPIGEGAQAIAGVLFLIANIPDGETGSFGTWAVEQAGTTVAFGSSIYLLEREIKNLLSSSAIVPAVLSGAVGGNLLAYGAREAADIGAIADGGVALTGSQATQVAETQQKQAEKQFTSQSFFARLFNIDESSSLLGRLADYIHPSLTSMGNELAGLFNVGHIFSDIVSMIMPKASAASQPYNWGFPVYGIPPDLLNSSDPTIQDPYQNANIVAGVLDNYDNPNSPLYNTANALIKEAATCFGDTVTNSSGVWDVEHVADVNPNGDSALTGQNYNSADCNNLSVIPYWNRMIMFVSDTSTAQDYGCWAGDATSCTDTGN